MSKVASKAVLGVFGQAGHTLVHTIIDYNRRLEISTTETTQMTCNFVFAHASCMFS